MRAERTSSDKAMFCKPTPVKDKVNSLTINCLRVNSFRVLGLEDFRVSGLKFFRVLGFQGF
jgi:hypothetical protein